MLSSFLPQYPWPCLHHLSSSCPSRFWHAFLSHSLQLVTLSSVLPLFCVYISILCATVPDYFLLLCLSLLFLGLESLTGGSLSSYFGFWGTGIVSATSSGSRCPNKHLWIVLKDIPGCGIICERYVLFGECEKCSVSGVPCMESTWREMGQNKNL
jgi:hypothetical protein